MALEEDLNEWLLANATNAGGRVRPVRIDQNDTLPAIAYQRLTNPNFHHLLGASGLTQPRIQIECYAATYAAAKALGEQVRQLDGFRGTLGTNGTVVRSCEKETDLDDYEEPLDASDKGRYRVLLDFVLAITETIPTF